MAQTINNNVISLNAQRNLFRAQNDYYDALYAYVMSTLRLKEAAGMLSVDDVLALSSIPAAIRRLCVMPVGG